MPEKQSALGGLSAGLKKFYFQIEDKYYDIADRIEAVGIPIYEKYIQPIEKRGVPSFPVSIGILLVLAILSALLLSVALASPETGNVLVTIRTTTEAGAPIPDASIVIIDKRNVFYAVNSTDGNGTFKTELPAGVVMIANASKDNLYGTTTFSTNSKQAIIFLKAVGPEPTPTSKPCSASDPMCFCDAPSSIKPCPTARVSSNNCNWDASSCSEQYISGQVKLFDANTQLAIKTAATIIAVDPFTTKELERKTTATGVATFTKLPNGNKVSFAVKAAGYVDYYESPQTVSPANNLFELYLTPSGSATYWLNTTIINKTSGIAMNGSLLIASTASEFNIYSSAVPLARHEVLLLEGEYSLRASRAEYAPKSRNATVPEDGEIQIVLAPFIQANASSCVVQPFIDDVEIGGTTYFNVTYVAALNETVNASVARSLNFSAWCGNALANTSDRLGNVSRANCTIQNVGSMVVSARVNDTNCSSSNAKVLPQVPLACSVESITSQARANEDAAFSIIYNGRGGIGKIKCGDANEQSASCLRGECTAACNFEAGGSYVVAAQVNGTACTPTTISVRPDHVNEPTCAIQLYPEAAGKGGKVHVDVYYNFLSTAPANGKIDVSIGSDLKQATGCTGTVGSCGFDYTANTQGTFMVNATVDGSTCGKTLGVDPVNYCAIGAPSNAERGKPFPVVVHYKAPTAPGTVSVLCGTTPVTATGCSQTEGSCIAYCNPNDLGSMSVSANAGLSSCASTVVVTDLPVPSEQCTITQMPKATLKSGDSANVVVDYFNFERGNVETPPAPPSVSPTPSPSPGASPSPAPSPPAPPSSSASAAASPFTGFATATGLEPPAPPSASPTPDDYVYDASHTPIYFVTDPKLPDACVKANDDASVINCNAAKALTGDGTKAVFVETDTVSCSTNILVGNPVTAPYCRVAPPELTAQSQDRITFTLSYGNLATPLTNLIPGTWGDEVIDASGCSGANGECRAQFSLTVSEAATRPAIYAIPSGPSCSATLALLPKTDVTHGICDNNQCLVLNGPGSACPATCQDVHSECNYETHQCEVVAGPGDALCYSDSQCNLPSHSICSNQQCVAVAGAGTSQCGTDADCNNPPKHADCNAANQCVAVDGAGPAKCQTDSQCGEQRHGICDNQQCVVVSGSGTNQCADANACNNPPKHADCNDNGQCVAVDGAGPAKCQTDSQCPQKFHTICSNNECKVVSGAGANDCAPSSNDCINMHNDCTANGKCDPVPNTSPNQGATCQDDSQCTDPNLFHNICQIGTCDEVHGSGTMMCTPKAAACGTHAECDGQRCVSKPGPGDSTCQTDAQCPVAEYHAVCDNQQCIQAYGSGTNQCTGTTCSGHAECNAQHQCVVVNGPGPATCQTDAQCSPDHPTCESGACNTAYGTGTLPPMCVAPPVANNAVCIGHHAECVNFQCLLVPNEGPSQCQVGTQCVPPTHAICSNQECVEVAGYEPNAQHCPMNCDGLVAKCVDQQCRNVPGTGSADCQTAGDCNPTTSPSCIVPDTVTVLTPPATTAIERVTYGNLAREPPEQKIKFYCDATNLNAISYATQCAGTTNEAGCTLQCIYADLEPRDTPTLAQPEGAACHGVAHLNAKIQVTHGICTNNQCLQINGPGTSSCSVDGDCTGKHNDCTNGATCVAVDNANHAVPEFATCYDDEVCKVKHAVCDYDQCKMVDGPGQDDCTVGSNECVGKHNDCTGGGECNPVNNANQGTPEGAKCYNDNVCKLESHTVCSNDQCKTVAGPGTSYCSTTAECVKKHNDCASGECKVVDNANPAVPEFATCDSNNQCKATHAICDKEQCIEVSGPGENDCTLGSNECIGKHNDCTANGLCEPVANTAPLQPATCHVDSVCSDPTKTHKMCEPNNCYSVYGEGTPQCTANANCPTDKHSECRNNACVQVNGAGNNLCLSDVQCNPNPAYDSCEDGSCVSRDGIGPNPPWCVAPPVAGNTACANVVQVCQDQQCKKLSAPQPGLLSCDRIDQCILPKTSICDNSDQCAQVNGDGTPQCTANANCQPNKHAECVNQACVQVNDRGDGNDYNHCQLDSDCVPETHGVCTAGVCEEMAGPGDPGSKHCAEMQCSGKTSKCVNQACTIVSGTEIATCSVSDPDCQPANAWCGVNLGAATAVTGDNLPIVISYTNAAGSTADVTVKNGAAVTATMSAPCSGGQCHTTNLFSEAGSYRIDAAIGATQCDYVVLTVDGDNPQHCEIPQPTLYVGTNTVRILAENIPNIQPNQVTASCGSGIAPIGGASCTTSNGLTTCTMRCDYASTGSTLLEATIQGHTCSPARANVNSNNPDTKSCEISLPDYYVSPGDSITATIDFINDQPPSPTLVDCDNGGPMVTATCTGAKCTADCAYPANAGVCTKKNIKVTTPLYSCGKVIPIGPVAATLEATVRDGGTSQPVGGATVSATDITGGAANSLGTKTTNANGKAIFDTGLAAGQIIRVNAANAAGTATDTANNELQCGTNVFELALETTTANINVNARDSAGDINPAYFEAMCGGATTGTCTGTPSCSLPINTGLQCAVTGRADWHLDQTSFTTGNNDLTLVLPACGAEGQVCCSLAHEYGRCHGPLFCNNGFCRKDAPVEEIEFCYEDTAQGRKPKLNVQEITMSANQIMPTDYIKLKKCAQPAGETSIEFLIRLVGDVSTECLRFDWNSNRLWFNTDETGARSCPTIGKTQRELDAVLHVSISGGSNDELQVPVRVYLNPMDGDAAFAGPDSVSGNGNPQLFYVVNNKIVAGQNSQVMIGGHEVQPGTGAAFTTKSTRTLSTSLFDYTVNYGATATDSLWGDAGPVGGGFIESCADPSNIKCCMAGWCSQEAIDAVVVALKQRALTVGQDSALRHNPTLLSLVYPDKPYAYSTIIQVPQGAYAPQTPNGDPGFHLQPVETTKDGHSVVLYFERR